MRTIMPQPFGPADGEPRAARYAPPAPPPLSADLAERLLVQVSSCLDWLLERAEHYETFFEECVCEPDSVFWWHDRKCGQQMAMEIRTLASDVRRLAR